MYRAVQAADSGFGHVKVRALIARVNPITVMAVSTYPVRVQRSDPAASLYFVQHPKCRHVSGQERPVQGVW